MFTKKWKNTANIFLALDIHNIFSGNECFCLNIHFYKRKLVVIQSLETMVAGVCQTQHHQEDKRSDNHDVFNSEAASP